MFNEANPKHEYRNPKQAQIYQYSNGKTGKA